MNKIVILAIISISAFVLSATAYVLYEEPVPEQKLFSELTCEEIRKLNRIGLQIANNDTTFSQDRIFDCLKEELDPIPLDPSRSIDHSKYYSSHTFSSDKYGKIKEWCLENNGEWFDIQNYCGFIDRIDGLRADALLDNRYDLKVTGINADNMCKIIGIACPDNPEFKGSYNLELGRTYSHYEHIDKRYQFYFDDDDPDKLAYRICEIENHDKYYDDCQWQKAYINKLIIK
jgi:hypothetical protein